MSVVLKRRTPGRAAPVLGFRMLDPQRSLRSHWGLRSQRRHREGFLLRWAFDQTGADRLDADARRLDPAVDLDLDALQVRLELASRLAGHLATDAAQVLRLAAASVAVSQSRFLAGDGTLLAHGPHPLSKTINIRPRQAQTRHGVGWI